MAKQGMAGNTSVLVIKQAVSTSLYIKIRLIKADLKKCAK